MTYLYILKSETADKHHIAISNDPHAKQEEINAGETQETYVGKHRPWTMVALFEIGNGKLSAGDLVTFVKRHQTEKLLQNLVDPSFIPEGKLKQLVRVPLEQK